MGDDVKILGTKRARALVTVLVAVLGATGLASGAVPAAANSSQHAAGDSSSGKEVAVAMANDPRGTPISMIIGRARQTDPQGYDQRLRSLKSSPEFTRFLTEFSGSPENGGIGGLAAVLTQQQVDSFITRIKGKSFNLVRDIDGKPNVVLSADSATQGDHSRLLTIDSAVAHARPGVKPAGWGYRCWQSAFAQVGYAAATGAICGAIGAFSAGIGWPTCFGFGVFGGGINWDAAC